MTAIEEPLSPPQPAAPTEDSQRTELPALCPYLATTDGTWRSATAVREHRCTAVMPPVPLALEKQRRLCLVADHTNCATYGAAQGAHANPRGSLGHVGRPVARMTPVILDQRRWALRLPALRGDRAPGQAILVGLLCLAFVAILVARPSGNAGPSMAGAAGVESPRTSIPPATAATAASPRASVTQATPSLAPTEEPAPSAATSPPPSAASPTASPATTPTTQPSTSGATYKVKSGDTLSAIAARYGTTTRVLVNLNGIADPSRLKVGQILKLP